MMPFAGKAIPRAYRITRSVRANRLFPVFTLNISIEIVKVVQVWFKVFSVRFMLRFLFGYLGPCAILKVFRSYTRETWRRVCRHPR
jgi:hypothetical protein